MVNGGGYDAHACFPLRGVLAWSQRYKVQSITRDSSDLALIYLSLSGQTCGSLSADSSTQT